LKINENKAFITNDRYDLLELVPKESIVLEIGVLKGDFSQGIIDAVNPKKLYLVDIWKHLQNTTDSTNADDDTQYDRYKNVCNRFWDEIKKGQVSIFNCSSSDINFIFKDEESTFDFVYIDGDHRYDQVVKDLYTTDLLLKKGGIMGIDDYHPNWIGVPTGFNYFMHNTDSKYEIIGQSRVEGTSSPSIYLRKL